jgi:hypothetical protein
MPKFSCAYPVPEAEVRIDPNGHRALVIARAEPFDYTTHFRSASLGTIAKKLNKKSVHYLRRNLDFLIKHGGEADAFLSSCCSQSGDKQGKADFNSWLALSGQPGYVTRAALKIYQWHCSLDRFWQRFVRMYVSDWSFNALTILSELNREILPLFFWGAELLREQRKKRKKKETKEELTVIAKACQGVRKVYNNQPLEIADWVYIYAMTCVERARFDVIRALATQIANSQNREVWLEDALASLSQLGYNTSAIDAGVKEKTPPAQKKVYTEADLEKEREKARLEALAAYEEKLEQAKEKARREALATYEEKLAQKEAELAAAFAQLEQVTQQLQTATTSAASSLNNSIEELMAQIAAKDQEIEWLKKRLDCALQNPPAPQTPTNSNLKIDALAVVSPTDPISTIFRDSTPPPPIELANYQKSAVYQNDWDSKKYQLSLVTARHEQTAKSSRHDNARKTSTLPPKKGFGFGRR